MLILTFIVFKTKSKIGFYFQFNSQAHIGTGPQYCHLWELLVNRLSDFGNDPDLCPDLRIFKEFSIIALISTIEGVGP